MKRVLFALSAVISIAQAASALNVDKLNLKLQKDGAGWKAKVTPLSGVSPAEARMHMGLRRDAPTVQFHVTRPGVRTELPAQLDWRAKDGGDWVSPILDQANCGSCVAYASIGVMETQYKIVSGLSTFNIRLSPDNLFSCGGGSCGWGWYPESAARYLRSTGVVDEACQPSLSGATGRDVACSAACPDSAQRRVAIAGYSTPTRGVFDIEALKQALQNGPLVTTLGVYEDFMSYGSGVYKHNQGEWLGGHAVSIVGYDDTTRSLIIRNSWGTGWGEDGFAHVSYDDVSGIGDETWLFNIPQLAGAVTVREPVDYTYFSGRAAFDATATFPLTDSIGLSLFDSKGHAVWTTNCEAKTCTPAVDVAAFPDGAYTVQAIAFDNAGQKLGSSPKQTFYVANQKPLLALSFTGSSGLDLNEPLSDRIEIDIHATSSSVPMSSIEFHYRGADGKDNMRAAATVVDGMTMGWRTNLVPNGTYEIWLVGRVKAGALETVAESEHKTVVTRN